MKVDVSGSGGAVTHDAELDRIECAGALIGGVVGALTMAGAAWGFNASTDRHRTTMSFADEFLHTLLASSVLRYLAVAHFGRGRGNFVEGEAPAFWQAEVEAALAVHAGEEAAAWASLRSDAVGAKDSESLVNIVTAVTQRTLAQLYPGSV